MRFHPKEPTNKNRDSKFPIFNSGIKRFTFCVPTIELRGYALGYGSQVPNHSQLTGSYGSFRWYRRKIRETIQCVTFLAKTDGGISIGLD